MRNISNILAVKPERKRHLKRSKFKCEDNIKMDLKK
jgi:hypothetical protein